MNREQFYKSKQWESFRKLVIQQRTDEDGFVHCCECGRMNAHGSAGTWPWSNTGAVDETVCKHIEVNGCLFFNGVYAPAIGNHTSDSTQADEYIRIHDCKFVNITGTMSAISLQTAKNIDIYSNTFDTCTQGVRQCQYSDAPTTVHDNRFIDVTTPYPTYSSAYINAYNNMIDGVFTA